MKGKDRGSRGVLVWGGFHIAWGCVGDACVVGRLGGGSLIVCGGGGGLRVG